MEVNFNYGFDEDSIIRLQKDLNHLLTHLDSQNVRKIYTERCEIKSEKGETVINGPLIEMYDLDAVTSQASTTLRLRMGFDESTNAFVFDLYTSDGVPTISMNSSGIATFSGDLNTAEDINVGNNIFIGYSSDLSLKGLYFNTTTPVMATSTGGHPPYESAAEGVTGLFWFKAIDYLNLVSTGNMEITAVGSLFLGVSLSTDSYTETRITMYTSGQMVLGSSQSMMLKPGTYGVIGVNWSSDLDSFGSNIMIRSTGYIEIASSGRILELAVTQLKAGCGTTDYTYTNYIDQRSTGIEIHTGSGNLYLGDSTNNSYLGNSATSSNLVATKGWAGGLGKYIIKSAAEIVNNSSVLQYDNDFDITLATTGVYSVETVLEVIGNTGAGIDISWAVSGGLTGLTNRGVTAPAGLTVYDLRDSQVWMQRIALATKGFYFTSSDPSTIVERFLAKVTASGTLKMQWSQHTAHASDLTMTTNSYMLITKRETY